MKKDKKRFVCQTCGTEYNRWSGKCDTCGNWNTILEEIGNERFHSKPLPIHKNLKYSKPRQLSEINPADVKRISTGFSELDLVFGGGIVPGSLILIGGEPGVGKSTLVLSIAKRLTNDLKILYISGEESPDQIGLRASRIGLDSKNLFLSSETIAENIFEMVKMENPDLVFIDSIQTITRENLINQAGTVTQLRESTQIFMELSKSTGIPIFLIGHITKDGSIAGPKVLEHLVDLVVYFETDKLNYYRLLRAVKNRFGPVGDVAIFEMTANGLTQVQNKHEIFITKDHENRTGSVLSAIMEGSRALTVEVQALVSRSAYSQSRRMSEGIDNRRLILLAAVIEKYLSYKMVECDIFSNLAGGLSIDEPSLDLAICVSIISSYLEKKIKSSTAVLGEVGLSGEIRSVSHILTRVKELSSLGLKNIYIPKGNLKELGNDKWNESTVFGVEHVNDLNDLFL